MVNCIFKRTANAILCLAFSINIGAKTIQVSSSYGGAWSERTATIVTEVEGFTPLNNARDAWNRYGSYKYLKGDSTGYFHVEKIDGRWWLIDPDGYANINRAVTSFSDPSTVQYDYDLCTRAGFNSAGNFVSSESQTKNAYNDYNYTTWGYTRRVPFHAGYKSKRKNYYPDYSTPSGDYVFVLDPKFENYCQETAANNMRSFAKEKDLIGWFTDNEIPFNEDQLTYMITKLDSLDPSRVATREWAAQKGLSEYDIAKGKPAVTNEIKKEFAGYLAEHYFSVVEKAVRAVDSVHLILGSRLHGRPRANMYVVKASHAHTDVTSVNFYDKYQPNDQIALATWTLDHPCMVTEFYIKDINYQASSQSGAGWYVKSQADRGYWYENTCLQLLASKCYVGWQYFRYMDDSGGSNKGIVTLDKKEYKDMTSSMRELNEQVYALCDFYDSTCRDTVCSPIQTSKATILASKDDASSETMAVCYARSSSSRKSAMVQFALPKDRGPILHAELQVNVASSDNAPHHLLFSSVNGMNDVKNDKNRIAFDLDSITTGWRSYDITAYLSAQSLDSLTLRIHALTATGQDVNFYSTKAAKELRPQLVITYMDDKSSGFFTSVQADVNVSNPQIYSLLGQAMGTNTDILPAGVYIMNGKKWAK